MATMTTRAATPASARRVNARMVLDRLWQAGGEALTANELMVITGLTRATVLAVCDDLVAMGWVRELPAAAPGQGLGRPPRRFVFRADAAYVIGVDVGDASIRGAVADLQGRIVGRAWRPAGFEAGERAQRDAAIREVIEESLASAGTSPDRVLVASMGLAAPVTSAGKTPVPATGSYWPRMSLDPRFSLGDSRGWAVQVSNDANLAALAVGAHHEADPQGNYVVLLAGERFGAGIVSDGRLLLGRDGAAGDMHFLGLLDGVRSQAGLAATARRLFRATSRTSAVDVFEQARAGDPAALEIVEDLADRLARVVSALASLLNPEQVVIGGAIAASADLLISRTVHQLPRYAQLLPRITASRLGGDIVLLGAISSGIGHVATKAFDTLPTLS